MIILHSLVNPIDIINLLVTDEIYKDCLKSENIHKETIDFKHHLWFEVIKDNTSIGIIWLTDFSHNCVTFHGGLFKQYRSKNTPQLLLECLRQLREMNTKITYITTVLKSNKPAINLLENIGFKPIMTIIKDNIIVYGDDEVITHG